MLFIASLLNSAILLAQATDSLPKDKIVSINIRGVAIEGSLLSRSAKEKLVIIIAGSGPTDRNGNSIAGVYSNAYKMLAQELSKNNISSFRYDKRAIGKSVVKNFKEKDLSFDDYINDVVAIYQYMKDSLGFKKIYFAGHSEGSLVGMVAAEKTNPQGYISIAGAGRPIDKVIVEQLTRQSAISGAQADSLFAILKTKNKIDTVPPHLLSIFHQSIQPYIVSWMKYDPAVEISKLKIPILILQGTCDIQVKVIDAENLHNANKKATLVLVDGMTHVLKDADAGCTDKGNKTYHDPLLPLDTKFVQAIVNFIK